MEDSVYRIDKKVDRQGTELREMDKRIKRLEGGGGSDEVFEYREAARKGMNVRKEDRNVSDREAMELREYDRARSSLKIFPIAGNTEEEMASNLFEFMSSILGLPSMNRDSIISIRRLGQTKYAPDEILVVYKECSTRDSVIGSSGRLAELVDKENNNTPKAGIRIVVPNHLKSTEKQLSDYGRRLRNKHGKGTKTHIKFDDGDRSIFLNVRLRGDEQWSRVYPEYARDWLKKMKSSEAEKFDQKFNCSGGGKRDLIRERSFSEMSTKPMPLEWNGGGSSGQVGSG